MSSQCKSVGCKKWVVVGVKYCDKHAAEAVPPDVRKVSLADITLSDTSKEGAKAMSVKELKKTITEAGLGFADCVEKSELQEGAEQAILIINS